MPYGSLSGESCCNCDDMAGARVHPGKELRIGCKNGIWIYGSHIRVEVNCAGRWTVVDVAGRGCMVPVLGVYIEELERLISSAESEILT